MRLYESRVAPSLKVLRCKRYDRVRCRDDLRGVGVGGSQGRLHPLGVVVEPLAVTPVPEGHERHREARGGGQRGRDGKHVADDARDAHDGLDREPEDPREVVGDLHRVGREPAEDVAGPGVVEEGRVLPEDAPEEPVPQVPDDAGLREAEHKHAPEVQHCVYRPGYHKEDDASLEGVRVPGKQAADHADAHQVRLDDREREPDHKGRAAEQKQPPLL